MVHVLLADAAVRTVSENIDMQTLRGACTRSDGLELNDF
jgi:hypothetical protein